MSKDNPKYNEKIFTSEQEANIIDMYVNQRISSVVIGTQFGCGHRVITKLLERNGIKRDYRSNQKYALNEKYFDNIDTQNKAYILGLLWADGSNCMSKDTISISLQESDRQILEDIRVELGSEKSLEYLDYSNKHDFGYTYKNQYRLTLFSSHMCKTLNNIGMVPNKSLVVKYPDIDHKFDSPFIRGVFDGDGYCSKSGYNCTITGTYDLCCKIQSILFANNINSHLTEASNHNGITYVLVISKKMDSIKFLNYIYNDAGMYLKRKHDIYVARYQNIAA